MDTSILLTYFLWFIIALATVMYLYVSANNNEKTNLEFFGSKKEINKGIVLAVSYFDGIIIGFLVYFLLSR
jgi:uncharacterized integral membrane protein